MVLTLDLREGIEEIAGDDPLAALAVGWQPSLAEVVMALDQAGADERVAGLLVRLDGEGPGFAQLQELRDAVRGFATRASSRSPMPTASASSARAMAATISRARSSGSTCSRSGTLGLTGLILEAPLARGLLDKLGVLPAGDRRGAYKTIYDTFAESAMTPGAPRVRCSPWWARSTSSSRQGLGEGRGLEPQTGSRS